MNRRFIGTAWMLAVAAALCASLALASGGKVFNRIATFPVYLNADTDVETVAEIVDTSVDGQTLVYTDGTAHQVGFVDITDPANPRADGVIGVLGEPTSVAVAGHYALVGVNTSDGDHVNPSGNLLVIDMTTRDIVATHPLGGQPDSVAVSPDGRYAAVVIENERDEDLGDGEPPQQPAGFLTIVDRVGAPTDWALRTVSFDGVPDLFPDDAEPEYVAINRSNRAVVTFQENNHIALVDLVSGTIVKDFSAGTVDLHHIDTAEEDPPIIRLNGRLHNVPREPDGVAWINDSFFATADEGDLFGGSRGITVFNESGTLQLSSGNSLEHEVVRLGHYPDDRSENKGNEPENVDVAEFDGKTYLFVASERSSVIFVYRIKGNQFEPVQTLPAGVGPEGVKAIAQRNLLVSAGENDDPEDKVFRGVLTIYALQEGEATYPTVVSADRGFGDTAGTPIPWAALSGLAVDDNDTVYTIHDSFYQQSRIYAMDVSRHPAVINDEIVLMDSLGKLAAVAPTMVNGDGTVNLDHEGIAVSASGGFWVASEGAGSVDDPDRPVTSANLLVHVAPSGEIDEVVTLPATVNERQRRFGFEGVASVMEGDNHDEILYVAFQRAWVGDPEPNGVNDGGKVRIGRYDTTTGEWTFAYYSLDPPQSPNGGWVGLSEMTALGHREFAVIERDNQANTEARIKRIYAFSVDGVIFNPEGVVFETVPKTLVHDLLPDLQATGGMVLEKIEGMTVLSDGTTLVVNDNDGVVDSNGETQLLRLEGPQRP